MAHVPEVDHNNLILVFINIISNINIIMWIGIAVVIAGVQIVLQNCLRWWNK